jgi:hypothetical protein
MPYSRLARWRSDTSAASATALRVMPRRERRLRTARPARPGRGSCRRHRRPAGRRRRQGVQRWGLTRGPCNIVLDMEIRPALKCLARTILHIVHPTSKPSHCQTTRTTMPSHPARAPAGRPCSRPRSPAARWMPTLDTWLNAEHGAGSATYARLKQACQAGVAEGWLCNREGGGIRYGRIFKPATTCTAFRSTWWTCRHRRPAPQPPERRDRPGHADRRRRAVRRPCPPAGWSARRAAPTAHRQPGPRAGAVPAAAGPHRIHQSRPRAVARSTGDDSVHP